MAVKLTSPSLNILKAHTNIHILYFIYQELCLLDLLIGSDVDVMDYISAYVLLPYTITHVLERQCKSTPVL